MLTFSYCRKKDWNYTFIPQYIIPGMVINEVQDICSFTFVKIVEKYTHTYGEEVGHIIVVLGSLIFRILGRGGRIKDYYYYYS
jgi:hypothetical protein